MARTKHTRPDVLRAESRLQEPYQPRGQDDQSSARLIARELKASGIFLDLPETSLPQNKSQKKISNLRIIVKPPRSGFQHPIGKSEILQLLNFFDDRVLYGLRSIKLAQGSHCKGNTLLMGRLETPGSIVLFDQPLSPWLLNGALTEPQRNLLENAGAAIEELGEGTQTQVFWKNDDLKNFMRFEVLMHEIGHHILQHYKGKRTVRIARTKDHDAFANLFAARCRTEYFAGVTGDR